MPAARLTGGGLWLVLPVLLVAGCRTTPATRPETPSRAPQASIADLTATIREDAQKSDHESEGAVRGQLADDATRNAEACLTLEGGAAACLYGRAVAYGLEARAHPTHANEFLKDMLETLTKAEAADPNYDEAGPARVRALVLLKAPAWPLGPGDADEGLIAAQRAVSLRPDYPANLLALAEALAKTGDAAGARQTYSRARDAALSRPASTDRDAWVREADQALQHR